MSSNSTKKEWRTARAFRSSLAAVAFSSLTNWKKRMRNFTRIARSPSLSLLFDVCRASCTCWMRPDATSPSRFVRSPHHRRPRRRHFTPYAWHCPLNWDENSPCTIGRPDRDHPTQPFWFSPVRLLAVVSLWRADSGTKFSLAFRWAATTTRIRPVRQCSDIVFREISFPATAIVAWWTVCGAFGLVCVCAGYIWCEAVRCCLQRDWERNKLI